VFIYEPEPILASRRIHAQGLSDAPVRVDPPPHVPNVADPTVWQAMSHSQRLRCLRTGPRCATPEGRANTISVLRAIEAQGRVREVDFAPLRRPAPRLSTADEGSDGPSDAQAFLGAFVRGCSK